MSAIDLETQRSVDAEIGILLRPDLYWAFSEIGDFLEDLVEQERVHVDGVAPGRAREFSSGRRAARHVLREAGCDVPAVGRDGRRPIWPAGFVGSVSHTRALAAACCGSSARYAGIGCDVEQIDRTVADGVKARIMIESEAASVSELRGGGMLVFAAKEAIFKAVNPITDEFFDFRDVILSPDLAAGTFDARCVGDRQSAAEINRGRGWFTSFRGHWVALYLLDA